MNTTHHRVATPDTQVIVVGAGPAGLVAGITLARFGVRVMVVEKRRHTSNLSRALVVSTRSMELLRSWGLEADIRAGAADVEPKLWLTESLVSPVGREVSLGFPSGAEAAAISPTRPAWVPQDHVEPVLLRLLESQPTAEVRFGCELAGLHQDVDRVVAQLAHSETGDREQVESLFIVGADGAHSAVRTQLGMAMEGADDLGEFERVEFVAPLAALAGDRRYGLYGLTPPQGFCNLGRRGRTNRWALSRECRSGRPRMAGLDEAQVVALIAAAAGADVQPIIERHSTFSFVGEIADEYRRDRGFLVGDAAHCVTPRGGTGMNMAMQDAYDLGWKLAWVLRAWADATLLDSYETDRRPVALHNLERSAERDGARRPIADTLPWDLNGRMAHQWTWQCGRRHSTLDLVGDGLTVLAGVEGGRWSDAVKRLHTRAPLTFHTLETPVARALGMESTGAMLLRPDARPVARWPELETFTSTSMPATYLRNPLQPLSLNQLAFTETTE